ncbi:MAG: hypothetical protein JSV24_06515 [Bacteroidales bacterium]|nr:MAG: hypothetical protein JSV24_06515 [Bacteroidales bacterium]
MKKSIFKWLSIPLTFIFISYVIGVRISEHTCFECGKTRVEIGDQFHNLLDINHLDKDHSHCCDTFHKTHEHHVQTCSCRFLKYIIPFENIHISPNLTSIPSIVLLQDPAGLTLFPGLQTYTFCSLSKNIRSENILTRISQFLT